jgi:Protein of unknown function (DUF2442)
MIRISKAELVGDYRVRLQLTDGTVVERDLAGLLVDPLYTKLKENPKLFNSVKVESGTLVWPSGLDLDPDMIIWGGPPPAEEHRQIS